MSEPPKPPAKHATTETNVAEAPEDDTAPASPDDENPTRLAGAEKALREELRLSREEAARAAAEQRDAHAAR